MEATGLLAEALRVGVRIGGRVERGPQGRRIDEAGAVLQAALEQVQGRAGVLAHGSRGILARTRGIRNPGEVEHRVAARDQVADRRVAGVDPNRVGRGRALGAVRASHSNDPMAFLRQQLGRPGTEEPGRSRDQEPHRRR